MIPGKAETEQGAAAEGARTGEDAPPLPPFQDVCAVVLAGGRGSRLGGIDKGLADFGGRPLVAHVLERIAPQVAEIIVSANRHPERYAAWGHRVVPDTRPDFAGPLAGFEAALAAVHLPWTVTVPCDSPFLPRDLVARLRAAADAGRADVAVASTGGELQPVFCLCRTALRDTVSDSLAAGGRSLRGWLDERRWVAVPFDDCAEAFDNLNTPADFARHEPPQERGR